MLDNYLCSHQTKLDRDIVSERADIVSYRTIIGNTCVWMLLIFDISIDIKQVIL